MADQDDQYPESEAQQRLTGILKGAFKGPPTSTKTIPKSVNGVRSKPKSNLSGKTGS